MVGEEGFEPPTLCSQSRCATRLRYSPYFYICLQNLLCEQTLARFSSCFIKQASLGLPALGVRETMKASLSIITHPKADALLPERCISSLNRTCDNTRPLCEGQFQSGFYLAYLNQSVTSPNCPLRRIFQRDIHGIQLIPNLIRLAIIFRCLGLGSCGN